MTEIAPQPRFEAQPAAAPAPAKGSGFGGRIRAWFLTGVAVAGPLAVTGYIVWWFIDTVDSSVRGLLPGNIFPDAYLPFRVPGLGVIIAFLALTLLGFLAHNIAGRSFIALGEAVLARMPVVRSIYRSVKQIFETLFSKSGATFRKVGMIEFPAKGSWSLVFISTPPSAAIATRIDSATPYVSVFLPCTPNPTTGFYFYLPADEIVELDLTPEAAATLIMSCGVIQPAAAAVVAAGQQRHEPAEA